MTLSPQEESFCAAYAEGVSGAEAARLAHYAPTNARGQASRMLTRPHISERVAELTAEITERRIRQQEELSARLDPIYEKARAGGDDDGVLQVIELQSRILGFVKGGGHARGSFQQRELERRAVARAEEDRRRAQRGWEAFQESERRREVEEAAAKAQSEARAQAEAEAEAEAQTATEAVELVALEPALPEQMPAVPPDPEVAREAVIPPQPTPIPEPPDPEPTKANISQHSAPGATYEDIIRAQAQAKRRRG